MVNRLDQYGDDPVALVDSLVAAFARAGLVSDDDFFSSRADTFRSLGRRPQRDPFGVSSRSEAAERAEELGLLGP